MLHFQTENYSFHKIIDEYLNSFALNMDKFMEVCQGAFGKLSIDKIKLDIAHVEKQIK